MEVSSPYATPFNYCEIRSTAGVMLLYLVDAISHSLQRELSGSIYSLSIISRPPAGAVDINYLRHVADR